LSIVLECLVVLREVISPSKGALIRALVIAEILSYNHYIFLNSRSNARVKLPHLI
jgi:hypothetical protein